MQTRDLTVKEVLQQSWLALDCFAPLRACSHFDAVNHVWERLPDKIQQLIKTVTHCFERTAREKLAARQFNCLTSENPYISVIVDITHEEVVKVAGRTLFVLGFLGCVWSCSAWFFKETLNNCCVRDFDEILRKNCAARKSIKC